MLLWTPVVCVSVCVTRMVMVIIIKRWPRLSSVCSPTRTRVSTFTRSFKKKSKRASSYENHKSCVSSTAAAAAVSPPPPTSTSPPTTPAPPATAPSTPAPPNASPGYRHRRQPTCIQQLYRRHNHRSPPSPNVPYSRRPKRCVCVFSLVLILYIHVLLILFRAPGYNQPSLSLSRYL